MAVGISHALDLIDGLNGLAGFTALALALYLATIAHQSGLIEHRDILLTVAAAFAGFLALNFPFGKIFLSDAGAYVIGHFLVWVSVSILWNAPNVTSFTMLPVFFWLVADMLLTITRRLALGKTISQPARLHFHHLVMRGIEISVSMRNTTDSKLDGDFSSVAFHCCSYDYRRSVICGPWQCSHRMCSLCGVFYCNLQTGRLACTKAASFCWPQNTQTVNSH